jgi:hypothetical protein
MGNISNSASNNSFAFILKNFRNSIKSIELFQLGLTNSFTPIDMAFAQDTTGHFISGYSDMNNLFIQNPSKPYPNGTSDADCIIFAQPVDTYLVMEDTASNIISSPPLPAGNTSDLESLNGGIQNLYEQFIANGWELGEGTIQFQFNAIPNVFPTWDKLSYQLIITRTDNKTTQIREIRIEQSAIPIATFPNIDSWFEPIRRIKSIANDVIIDTGGGMPYNEINRSQSGAFLDIRGISVQVLGSSASSLYTQNSQNLNSLGFLKLNPTGDDYIGYLNPTISPYQTQNVVNDINMNDKSGLFVLDGNTRFDYDLNPLTNVEIVFNYVQFPNYILKYGYQVAGAIIDVRQAEQDIINKNDGIRKNYKLDVTKKDVKKIANLLDYIKK